MALDVTASGVSPNTDTCSSEGDLAGGGVSRAEPEASGGGYEGGRGDKALPVTGIACCGIAAGDVPLLFPGETPGGGRVIGLMTSSSIFGNAMPAALAALSAAPLAFSAATAAEEASCFVRIRSFAAASFLRAIARRRSRSAARRIAGEFLSAIATQDNGP